MSDILVAEHIALDEAIRIDMDWNVLDENGKPKPYTAEQQVQLFRLFLRHNMAWQAYYHHRRFADIINDDAGLERKDMKHRAMLKQIRELIAHFDTP